MLYIGLLINVCYRSNKEEDKVKQANHTDKDDQVKAELKVAYLDYLRQRKINKLKLVGILILL
jgi:hypothetical protein